VLNAGDARIRAFRVIPALPEPLAPLLELARNFWWTWRPEAADLFRRLDRDLWQTTSHNPVKMLGAIPQEVLDRAAADPGYLHALGEAVATMRGHLAAAPWSRLATGDETATPKRTEEDEQMLVAYFCAEFGLTECFQVYSGGLGCLAGDHLKSASELTLPLVGVGLLYRNGYFHQYLNADGWQQERYEDLDFANQPIQRELENGDGEQLKVRVEIDGRTVHAGIWRADVGRIPLYLLDTNLPENSREDRDITRNLYGGDVETRIRQEIVLGVGGVRALRTLGLAPTVFHMNEGHSAFLALERIAEMRSETGMSFDEAREAAAAQHVFTTHTPVPAGIDRFAPDLVERHLGHMADRIGLDLDGMLALGRENVFDRHEFFSMAVLALRTSGRCNAVSRLHGEVSRRMWRGIWPGVPEPEAPITHVTNGVHTRSWLSPNMLRLFDRYLPSGWHTDPTDHSVWRQVADIPDEELWQAHSRQREELVTWARRRIRGQMEHRGAGHEEIEEAAAALDPTIFTIGFARRFATYKRATLLLRDLQRLRDLLEDDDRPIQIIIAGKAHPADGPGKEMIREIVKASERGGRFSRLVFLEDYDIDVARLLVRGCDIWLNTPRRGMEASGTSGMKAALNGLVNVSVLDGWWDEGFTGDAGFAIGRGESYDEAELQDTIESRALYDLLERQILPEFYDRGVAGVPRKWIQRMKRSIMAAAPAFNTNRMVSEYAEHLYLPAHRSGQALLDDGGAEARDLAAHIRRYREHWKAIRIERVTSPIGPRVPIRTSAPVSAEVFLGALTPEEVSVQLYFGEVTSFGDLVHAHSMAMRCTEQLGDGRWRFEGEMVADRSGSMGFSVRVLPNDSRLPTPFVPGLITWDVEQPAGAEQRREPSAAHAGRGG
jgi:starch phosphorylase